MAGHLACHMRRPGLLEAAGGRVAMQPLPAADRHLPLQGEHRQREPPSEPGVALIAPAPARRGSFDIGRNHVVYGISFPPFPTFPGSPSPGFCLDQGAIYSPDNPARACRRRRSKASGRRSRRSATETSSGRMARRSLNQIPILDR